MTWNYLSGVLSKVGQTFIAESKLKNLYLLLALVAPLWLTPAFADRIDIDNAKLKGLIDAGVPVVDVRRIDEWKSTGVIDGSHLLTFFDAKGNYDPKKWLGDLSELINPEEPFVLICQSGARSFNVSDWLGKNFETVYNHQRGIGHWIKEGNKTVSAP